MNNQAKYTSYLQSKIPTGTAFICNPNMEAEETNHRLRRLLKNYDVISLSFEEWLKLNHVEKPVFRITLEEWQDNFEAFNEQVEFKYNQSMMYTMVEKFYKFIKEKE